MADVLSNYRAGDAFDEMIDAEGSVRPSYRAVYSALSRSTSDDLRVIAESLTNNYTQAGVTFDVGGVERPFPLDLVPRVIASPEWEIIEAGVAQRVRALEAFLSDIYSDARVISDGVIPSQLITSSTHFHRAVWGIQPGNGVRIHVAGVDLIRNPVGDVRVLEDNVRVPSGVSYVMTNRNAMVTAMPEAFANQRIRPVAGYPTRLLTALRKAAPSGVEEPTVVVLTPGVYNSAYFEHTLLARTMGVELVEGRDLECRRGKVFMRTTAGLQRVDVIYRRVDDEFLDPVHFRSDSMLGVPGLVNAVRTGGVTLANAIGNGVADDKLIYTYVPDLIKYYLRDEPILPNVDTWRLEEDQAREEVLDRLEELVVKPVDGSGGKGIVIGPRATKAELNALRRRVSEDPRGWIAQPVVQLSTVPTLIEDCLQPRHVDLRPFAVNNGEDIWVLPGGLTRVALPEGELVVNSSQGGGSKDTWVLSPPPHRSSATHRSVTEHRQESDDQPKPTTEVPLTVAMVPLAVVPNIVESQRQHQDQRQQQDQQQQAQPRSSGC
ncbi:MAG TPA: circularly permuted type 2 ATP-grasp protein [Propionibacteriaceae bacterium]|nr:circularly permuted type 2 ATP-grasp protein [Propionibacteriaceae bacterium]